MNEWDRWEDYQAGLYNEFYTDAEVVASRSLLSDPDRFYHAAAEMVRAWPNAARQNLSHMWSGRNAWVGQASCLYVHDAPAAATREAWGQLDGPTHQRANRVATLVRDEWERGTGGSQTLFDD